MKSTLISSLSILQSIAHIPATLQSVGRSGVTRDLELTRDEVFGGHLSVAGQGIELHNGGEAIAKGKGDSGEKDWDTICEEAEQKRVEALASSLRKLRNGEEHLDEPNVLEDFLLSDEAEAAKFTRLRNALSKMILDNPSIMQESERIDAPIFELRKLLEAKLEGKEVELLQCKNMFLQARLDFHLTVHLRSLMRAIENPALQRKSKISKAVARAIGSVYKSDHDNFYYQVDDRILLGLRTARASLHQEEMSTNWNAKLEKALRGVAKRMRSKRESHDFIQLCETCIFREPRPNNWYRQHNILRPHQNWGWSQDPWA